MPSPSLGTSDSAIPYQIPYIKSQHYFFKRLMRCEPYTFVYTFSCFRERYTTIYITDVLFFIHLSLHDGTATFTGHVLDVVTNGHIICERYMPQRCVVIVAILQLATIPVWILRLIGKGIIGRDTAIQGYNCSIWTRVVSALSNTLRAHAAIRRKLLLSVLHSCNPPLAPLFFQQS
jgi:hypothetical protein